MERADPPPNQSSPLSPPMMVPFKVVTPGCLVASSNKVCAYLPDEVHKTGVNAQNMHPYHLGS